MANKDEDNNEINEANYASTIESLFSTYVLLDTFLSAEFTNEAKTFHAKATTPRAKEGLLQGFKLLVVTTLDSYINGVVRVPEVLGLEPDFDYRDYWSFTKGRGREVTRTATRSDHDISRYVAKADEMIRELLGLGTWEGINKFGERTKSFIQSLKMISEEAYQVTKNGEEGSVREALLIAANNRLWTTSCNTTPIPHRYEDYFIIKRNDPILSSLDDLVHDSHLMSGHTRLDGTSAIASFMPRPVPEHWAQGYVFTVHESLKLLANDVQHNRLSTLDELVQNAKKWKDVRSYDSKMTWVYGKPKYFTGYTYRLLAKITEDSRLPLVGKVGTAISPERLLSIFGNKARIVERGFPGAFVSFACLLDGAVKGSKKVKEKAKVAIIVHKNQWGQEEYSVAIFMPAYGLFSNASIWWVFYSIGDKDSRGTSPILREVLKKINRNKKSIEVMSVEADKEEFYRYCEDPGYTRLSDAIVLTNRVTNEIKGVFPELLLSNMLINQGYSKVANRIRPKILKSTKGEIDTYGVKYDGDIPSQIILFESKGQATDENELQKEVDKFSENINVIKQHLKLFCEEIQILYSEDIFIEAVFVSMGTVDDANKVPKPFERTILSFSGPSIYVPDNITLWDFNELIKQLTRAKMPRLYIEQLKAIPVATII